MSEIPLEPGFHLFFFFCFHYLSKNLIVLYCMIMYLLDIRQYAQQIVDVLSDIDSQVERIRIPQLQDETGFPSSTCVPLPFFYF